MGDLVSECVVVSVYGFGLFCVCCKDRIDDFEVVRWEREWRRERNIIIISRLG